MADPKSAPEPQWEDGAGYSRGTEEALSPLTPEKDPLWAPIPPVMRRLEEGGAAGEDRAGMVNDCTDRVMGMLGMGHRLFVPRLLAVRDVSCEKKSLQLFNVIL